MSRLSHRRRRRRHQDRGDRARRRRAAIARAAPRRRRRRGDYAATVDADRAPRRRARSASSACGPRVGVGMPGAVSPATGLIKNANSTWLNGHALRPPTSRGAARARSASTNDANCFALSEASDGAGAGRRVVFGVILGTGVGGGIVDRRPGLGRRQRDRRRVGPQRAALADRADELPGPAVLLRPPRLHRDLPVRARRSPPTTRRRGRRPPSRARTSSRARARATPPREATLERYGDRLAARARRRRSTCSTPTSSCSAAACRTSPRSRGGAGAAAGARLLRRGEDAGRPEPARRLVRRARRRLAVAAGATRARAAAGAGSARFRRPRRRSRRGTDAA